MLFQRVNRSDPEKVFIVVKNGSGATLTAGYPGFIDLEMTTPDGVQVTNSTVSTTGTQTLLGVADADIATGQYGLLQVYGFRADVRCLSSAGVNAKGSILTYVNATNGFTPAADATASSKAWGVLCEAIAASSSSAYYTTADCFLRCL